MTTDKDISNREAPLSSNNTTMGTRMYIGVGGMTIHGAGWTAAAVLALLVSVSQIAHAADGPLRVQLRGFNLHLGGKVFRPPELERAPDTVADQVTAWEKVLADVAKGRQEVRVKLDKTTMYLTLARLVHAAGAAGVERILLKHHRKTVTFELPPIGDCEECAPEPAASKLRQPFNERAEVYALGRRPAHPRGSADKKVEPDPPPLRLALWLDHRGGVYVGGWGGVLGPRNGAKTGPTISPTPRGLNLTELEAVLSEVKTAYPHEDTVTISAAMTAAAVEVALLAAACTRTSKGKPLFPNLRMGILGTDLENGR